MTVRFRGKTAQLAHRAALSLVLTMVAAQALAVEANAPTAFKGFGNNKDPIQIEADNMSVATPDQVVTFTGGVNVKQKDSTLATQTLKVFYDNSPQSQAVAQTQAQTQAQATPASPTTPNAQLRRFEAAGGVKITEPDQSVTGDSGWFDIASQKAEVDGHVVLTQAKNVARGSRLLINLKTGEYKLEGGGPAGRIQLLIDPNSKDAPAMPAKSK
jgi:lipopolysaccharide export system protein LptA